MARNNSFFRSGHLTFAQQIGRMSASHSGFRPKFNRKGVFWVGQLQPSPVSEKYVVRIDYTLRKRPKVWVLEPALRRRRVDQKIPHTFYDGSVCLHVHADWTPGMFIADTIIPWLSLWLYHYETWHAIDAWLGGGHEPGAGK